MKAARFFFSLLLLLARPALAQLHPIPPGAYRTAEAYHRRLPQPAGTNAFYPDKRGLLVVEVQQGASTQKVRMAPDSVWGYVSGKGRTFRFFRGEEYQLLYADTLCVYADTIGLAKGAQPLSAPRYFFSRGLKGLVFPLTVHYLREMYEASNPTFVAALGQLRFDQSLSDFDRKTGLYRVTTLYRQAAVH
ncbi:hypothetical protein Q3A66_18665 [Hymenobacter sp. BT770]|uniref:hypothetical protein n=1 Tax=Hymenobacter sp. BT770 TaxID=2886942 RepID=UPI001D125947|nr:hypothetical protein [Hymenobacter sp. BT770]MCC3151986.1 hypothetical protein [Hymenobacter sp. BT770]MDO3417096.1 hypothetical protein [Hymenobacter sp. BT770]